LTLKFNFDIIYIVKKHLRISGENYRRTRKRAIIWHSNRTTTAKSLASSCSSSKLL
jgi:hypothetical protein